MIQVVSKSDESPARLNAREERARRNLVKFVEDSGYAVTTVADLSGISQASLTRYMNGKSPLPFDALQPLADVLGRESILDFQNPDPPRQRTMAELEAAQPMFARARPGFEPTEEDLQDFQEYLKKVQSRREKKNKPKSSR
jgi:transcriptional regulator with XRE-family HTH domain